MKITAMVFIHSTEDGGPRRPMKLKGAIRGTDSWISGEITLEAPNELFSSLVVRQGCPTIKMTLETTATNSASKSNRSKRLLPRATK